MAQTQEPPGDDKSAKTHLLDLGAKALQGNAPLGPMDVYLVLGSHPMKDQPQQQMEAHHFCHQVNQDVAQCVLCRRNNAATGTLTTQRSSAGNWGLRAFPQSPKRR